MIKNILMKFYFDPEKQDDFKNKALNYYVRTLIFEEQANTHRCFVRKVKKKWKQTVKNNIETDHRIKKLPKDKNYRIYSWVVEKSLICLALLKI